MTAPQAAPVSNEPVDPEDWSVPGPHSDTPVRLYRAAGIRDEALGLVWCHGGAYAYGDLDMPESHWVATSLAQHGITVITVDYSLAPVPSWAVEAGAPAGRGESIYPVAREDVASVLAWADAELADLSPAGWALGGSSAGGTLAASLTMCLRDTGGRLPRRLLLAYPLVHAILPPYSPELQVKLDTRLQPAPIPLTRETVEALCVNYVGGDRTLLDDAHAFPGSHDTTGFPPTLVVHSDIDTIRASSATFAAELATAGVDVVSILEPDTEHGHLNTPEVPGAQRSVWRMAEWLAADWV